MAEKSPDAADTSSGIARRRKKAADGNSPEYNQRKQQLIEAAAHLFKQRGFSGVKLSEIAEAAGIDRGNLYYYAESKEDLYLQVLLSVRAQAATHAEAVSKSNRPAAERLRLLMVELMKDLSNQYPYLYLHFYENLDAIAALYPDDPRVQEVAKWTDRHFAAFRKVVRDGMKDGTFASTISSGIVAEAAVGIIVHSNTWYDPRKARLSGAEIGAAFAQIFLNGLCTDRAADL
jgi:TetR/AcrR family transcriptional regulator, cholesterol catabolism regulator